jgi:uncharacterized protein YjbI with pentapeptide repeats
VWTLPFWAFEWALEWIAFVLSRWTFLDVLEYLEGFSVLIAVIFYFSESGDRLKQKHYQAWQVINTAQGKGGNGGRIDALEELNTDGVPLVGVDVSGAFLQSVHLERARLLRSNFSAADLRDSHFNFADFSDANLHTANFRHSHLNGAGFQRADVGDADLVDADLSDADFSGATLTNADLRNANLSNLHWRDIADLKNANIFGVKNAPDGFVSWAKQHGAIQTGPDSP